MLIYLQFHVSFFTFIFVFFDLILLLLYVKQFGIHITHARFVWHREAVKNVFNPYFDKGKLLLDQRLAW